MSNQLNRLILLCVMMITPLITWAQVDSAKYNRSLIKQQGVPYNPAPTTSATGKTKPVKEEIIYDRIRSMIKVNDPAYGIAYATSNNLKTYSPPHTLRDVEGADGYIMELRLAQRFPILQPTYEYSDWFIRTKWLTINYDFQYRIAMHAQTSSDSPGLPLNTKFGITILEYMIPLSLKDSGYYKSSRSSEPKPFNVDKLGRGYFKKDNLVLMVPRLDFMHYSNGQHDTARYIPAPGVASVRNNYANGNFSTNYVQGQLDFYTFNRNNQLLNLYIGYRFDFGIANLLSYEPTQEDRYGKQRLLAGGTIRSGPMRAFYKVRDPAYNKLMSLYFENLKKCDSVSTRKECQKKYEKDRKKIADTKLNGTLEWYLRLNYEYICDYTKDLKDHKTGITIQTGLFFTDTRCASLNFQYHYGRDYMNVRYDMPVSNFLVGLNFAINGYTAAATAVAKKASQRKKVTKGTGSE